MEYLRPDDYAKLWSKKSLKEIEEEKKKIEEVLTVAAADAGISDANIMMKNNVSNLELLEEVAPEDREYDLAIDEEAIEKKNAAIIDSEKSKITLYMSYLRTLNRLITEKSLYTDESLFKTLLRTKSQDELIETRNKLVNDINAYYKSLEKIKARSILLASPLTRWMVKEDDLIENADSVEVIMKKEEYVKFIDNELLHINSN